MFEFCGNLQSFVLNSGSTDSCRPTYWHYSIKLCLYSVQRAHCHFTGDLNMWLSQLFHLKFLLLSLTPYGGLNIICSWFFGMCRTQTKGTLQRFAALTHEVEAEGWLVGESVKSGNDTPLFCLCISCLIFPKQCDLPTGVVLGLWNHRKSQRSPQCVINH